ncbi:uncharacterized protein BDV17DRAFT_292387 [Aspergillus undulatus]|uniref:uncharacterized protein n=1 Tax=Aspergillus undulatus TaxID=1810928 RepID=UPI003CCD2E9F
MMATKTTSPPSNQPNPTKMSAPYPGRQSPPPERQTGAQENSPPAAGRGPQDPEHQANNAQQNQNEQTRGLSSNPKHPLEDLEEAKFRKGTGN